jgi:hypothetical protein
VTFNEDESGDDMQSTYVADKGSSAEVKPCASMLKHKNTFSQLLVANEVVTKFPIISMIINYESTRTLTLTYGIPAEDDNDEDVEKGIEGAYWIKQYSLSTYKLEFQEILGGKKKDFMKCKEIEQSPLGDKYLVCYNNDGVFYFRDFNKYASTEKKQRTQEEVDCSTVNVNKLLGIKPNTMCHNDFHDPYMTGCFIDQDIIFVSVFENFSLTHYHFFFDLVKRTLVGEVHVKKMEGIMPGTDFPIKCFYNEDLKEVYLFYRQGNSFILNIKEGIQTNDYTFDCITDTNLGQMVLVYGEALIVSQSKDIVFYKIEVDEDTEERTWKPYFQIVHCGSLYFIKGNIRIQVTTSDKIFFYLIDKNNFMPTLENVMKNYMSCSQMMFGMKVRYSITYKVNEKAFNIYTRRLEHDFKSTISVENFESAIGMELKSTNQFLVTQIDKVFVLDQSTFEITDQLPISLMKSTEREPNQVIAMTKS